MAYTTTPGGINVADGSLVYSVTDLAMGSLQLQRYHRSGSKQPNDPMFGWNFASNFDIFLTKNVQISGSADYPIVHIGSSVTGMYVQDHGSTSIYPDNLDSQKGILSWNGSQYVYTDSSGTIYTFSATIVAKGALWEAYSRKIERIDFPDGRRQTFSYNSSGYLKLVEDSSGSALVFDYNAYGDVTAACIFNRSQSYVSAASTCAGAIRKTSYGYTTDSGSRHLLTSATDVFGKITSYTNAYQGVTCIKPPGYSSCKISLSGSSDNGEFPSFGITETLAGGGVWQVNGWDGASVPKNEAGSEAPYNGHNEITVVDPDNKTISLTFTKTSPYTMTDANGRLTTFLFEGAVPFDDPWAGYSAGSLLTQAVYPEGNKYLAEYNGPFKTVTKETEVAKPGSGLPNRVVTRGYGSCASPGTYQNCAKPIWIKDAKGNQTDYTYATWGGMLSEMEPAPTIGAARPLKLRTYVQKYAYIKNSGGSLVPAATPVWLPASEKVCQTVAGSSTPVCDSTAPQRVTTFEYGANGTADDLLLRGVVVTADGQSHRTCYGYDQWGDKVWETEPNAGLASCS